VARWPGENLLEMKRELRAHGALEQAESVRGFGRVAHIRPDGASVFAFAGVFVLALAFGVCRLRFAWWPLHPVVFVFLNEWTGRYMAFSFLLGWLIKVAVNRYGGSILYQRLKPLMIGLIAGDMLGRFMPTLVGTLYYALTGERPF
jgi:hypothetical protein